jgi:hypothetical protein
MRTKGSNLSVVTLLVIIVVAAIVLPMLLSRLGIRSGFVDIGEPIAVPPNPLAQVQSKGSMFLPCRNSGGQSCPEGTFCDGATNNCTPIAVAGI